MKVLDAAKDTYLMSNDEFLVVQGVKGFEELKDIENIPNEVRSLGDVEIVLDQMVWEDLAYETGIKFHYERYTGQVDYICGATEDDGEGLVRYISCENDFHRACSWSSDLDSNPMCMPFSFK
ncbi:hypothetical protein ACFX2G_041166 [Malus domestica]